MPGFRTPERVLYDVSGSFCRLETLEEARSVLYWMVAESHELISQNRPYRLGLTFEQKDLQDYLQKQEQHLVTYSSWLQEFDKLCTTRTDRTAAANASIALLRVVHAITVFWLSTCLDRYEALCDSYNQYFETIIRNAEEVVAYNHSLPHGSLPFTFEMGIIPPMYLVVLKCREPTLRYQALSLLSRAPEREGLWRREEALRVASRVADLESKDFEVLADGTIFQNARVCDVQINFSNELGSHVAFTAKLYGSDQTWKVWDEIIPLEKGLNEDEPEPFGYPSEYLGQEDIQCG